MLQQRLEAVIDLYHRHEYTNSRITVRGCTGKAMQGKRRHCRDVNCATTKCEYDFLYTFVSIACVHESEHIVVATGAYVAILPFYY